MPRATVSISTGTLTSPSVNTNWIGGKPISASLVWNSSTSSGTATVQFTLDDIQLVASPTWVSYSSAVGQAATSFTSQSFGVNNLISFLSPVAGLRLNSTTAISSGTVSLTVLQGEGW